MSCWSIFGQWMSYPLLPLCGVVLLVWRGLGLAFDRTKMIVVPLVLVGQCGVLTLVRVGMLH
jgi:hypothetical protein